MSNIAIAVDVFGASTPFAPKSLPGLVLDLDPAHGITLSGSNVTAWADQSGTGDANKNATDGAVAPTFLSSSASYNGQPVVVIGAPITCCMVTGAWSTPLPQPCTVVFVGHAIGAGNAYGFDSLSAGSQMGMSGLASNVGLYAGAAGINSGVSTQGIPSCCTAIFQASPNASIAVNTKTPQATGNVGTNGATGFTIGNWAGQSQSLHGQIARMLVWNRALSATDIGKLAPYITSTYGVTIGP